MMVVITKTKMASSNPVPSVFPTATWSLPRQNSDTLRLILGNCSELLTYTTTSMNNTFNYMCEHWCGTYNEPTVTCCAAIHTLAVTNDVIKGQNQTTSLSFEANLLEIYDVIMKYQDVVNNITVDAEKRMCQIHWSRGLQCVFPRSCETTTEDTERVFCYLQTLKLNMDSLRMLFKDALTFISHDSPVTSSTQSLEPDDVMMHGLNQLLNLARALRAYKQLTSSLETIRANTN